MRRRSTKQEECWSTWLGVPFLVGEIFGYLLYGVRLLAEAFRVRWAGQLMHFMGNPLARCIPIPWVFGYSDYRVEMDPLDNLLSRR